MCLSNPTPPLLNLKANELCIHWSWILLGLLCFLRVQQTSTFRWVLIGLLLDCSNVSCRLSLPWTTCWQSKQNLQTSETVWCVWSDFLRNTKDWKEKPRFVCVFLPFLWTWKVVAVASDRHAHSLSKGGQRTQECPKPGPSGTPLPPQVSKEVCTWAPVMSNGCCAEFHLGCEASRWDWRLRWGESSGRPCPPQGVPTRGGAGEGVCVQ